MWTDDEIKGKILHKEEILFTKPTGYGTEVSVNSEKKEKIINYVGKFLDKE